MVDPSGVEAMVDPSGVQAMLNPTGVQAMVNPSGYQAKVDPRRSFLRRFKSSNNTEASSSEKEEGSEDDSEDEDVESYRRLVNDGGQQLYPGCKKFSKLQFLVRLLNIKNVRGMTNAAFEDMLTLFREALPEGHSLPKKFHEAKQYIRGVGLAYDTYDACLNDCIIFRGIHAKANVCPVCKTSRWKTVRSVVGEKRISRVAMKVIRHFPLNKRVRRLCISNKTASLMSWHNDGRTKDEVMRHPADSPAWKNFDSSIWPIILIPYNFPPWICMKETNFILSVIVPGRRSPGKDIDVYLQLVIDELQELWHHGVLVYDSHFGKKFRVYAALLWTISDWLGRGILSGESIVACSPCLLGTCSRRLKHGHKACFLGHRRFLSMNHPFRSDEESFDGTTDFREPPVQPTGEEISAMTMDIQTAYGKLQKQKRIGRKKRNRGEVDEDLENMEEVHTIESTFKKRSIFFQLEFCLSKDNAKARMDMKRMKIREHLHIDETQEKPDLPEAVYYMESSKKKMFCGLVKNVRFPDNHASSMYNKVRLEENKFVGLKTHDCHILFEEILPLAVMKTLPEEVALPLVKLAKCFKVITSKIVSNKEIAIVEEQLPEISCQLEKIFPPTFFDIMEHLVIHLPAEVRLAGPVQFRNMWSTEMFIGNMKNWVHNRSHPEGSIADSYLFDECLTFCSRYVDDCNTKFNKAPRHDDNMTSSANKNCSKYLKIFGRPLSACSTSELDHLSWTQAQKYVLFNYEHINYYTEKHMKALAAGKKKKNKRQVEAEHHRTFHLWFIDHVQSLLLKGTKLPAEIVLLANKPYMMVKKYNSYSINGCVFHTKEFAAGKSTQCDGVSNSAMTSSCSSSKDKNPVKGEVEYYGRIVEIVELNYSNQGSVVLFKCEWSKPAGVKNITNFGVTQVNLKQLEFGSEPFIFTSQAKQIYYVKDVVDDDWFIHIAKATGYLPGNQQIVENETIYEQLEEDEEDDSDEEDDEEEDGAEDGQRAFFNVEERHRYWVLKSAGKKWKDFKCYLKKKHYKSKLSIEENVANGCGQRLPEAQWDWLRLSRKNKTARKNQPNSTHTTGSRSFAVVQDQTNEINAKLNANPELHGEEPNPNDMYSTLFPKAKKSTRYGLGMVVGGKGSENLAEALAALEESRKETRDLKRVVENMARKTDIIESQLSQLMLVYQASQKIQDNQQQQQQTSEEGMEGIPTIQETRSTEETLVRRSQKPSHTSEVGGSQAKETRSTEETLVRRSQKPSHTSEVGGSQAKTASVNKIIKTVKMEKAQENRMKNSEVKKRKNKGPVKVTKGMDVALTSPYNEAVVALGTVQNADTDEFIEVMINMVLKRTTRLPQAKGRMTLLGHAEARSVQWPRKNISTEEVDMDMTHASIMSCMDKNLRIHSGSDGKVMTLEEQAANREMRRRAENPDSQTTKRRRTFTFKSKASIGDGNKADDV
ncbi:hypothetical protein QYE76_057359 [Lolium multiflorum]|uniref:Transposon protein n=1 Tax=Lolium multiflorum TaxID=4521 RepID=A0AAD8T4A1_LOLMU|nr:hypothetical protein QYE76_057359 [Lolium multiflorum]